MRHRSRIALLVALIVITPVLAGCENFDPDSMDIFGLNSKKKLPGKRELLFPGGVPGVSQGIPPEYMKGYHEETVSLPPGDSDAQGAANQTAAAKPAVNGAPVKPVRESKLTEPKSKPRPRHVVHRKPKPATKTVAKPKPASQETASQPPAGQGTSAPWPSAQPSQQQQQGTSSAWPASQQTQAGWPTASGDQQGQKLAPWPSAPPSGTFTK